MPIGRYREQYENFWGQLQHLKAIANLANPDPQTLQSDFLEAQQFFQNRILSIDLDDLEESQSEESSDTSIVSKIQAIQTEIAKQMRILAMDVMFLQSARQPRTAQQRQRQMSDRLTLLLNYCAVLLGESTEEKGS